MDGFERTGEIMLLAEQGRQHFARELSAAVGRWWLNFRKWQARMPTSMPPTESHQS